MGLGYAADLFDSWVFAERFLGSLPQAIRYGCGARTQDGPVNDSHCASAVRKRNPGIEGDRNHGVLPATRVGSFRTTKRSAWGMAAVW